MTTDRLNELRELREIVMGEFNTDYGGGNVGLTPAGEKLVALIDATISADSATQGSTDGDVISGEFSAAEIVPSTSGWKVFSPSVSAARNATDGDVRRAIEEMHDNIFGCECADCQKHNEPYRTAITALSAYRRPTADEVAEIDRAIEYYQSMLEYRKSIEEETRKHYGGNLPEWHETANKMDAIAITALRKMKGV